MMENNILISGSCIVFRNKQVLLVKHTYGAAKGKYLIPGGCSEKGEMPGKTAEREVLEETKVNVIAKRLVAIRFVADAVWCIFDAEYISGEPVSDCNENDSAIFMDIDKAIESEEVVETTRVLIKSLLNSKKQGLEKSSFVNSRFSSDEWQLYI